VIEGRSKQVFKDWLEARAQAFRDSVEVVAMDGFTGYKSAAVEAIDTVVTVMDPYHVVAPVGDKLDQCRQRIQQETLGHRGRSGDPLYGIRRVARTRAALLTEKQQHRLLKVLTDERHAAFEATWSVYQDVIDAYQADDPAEGKAIMTRLIDSLQSGVPAGLNELRSLGKTLHRRRDDILAIFDHPGTSNGPSEAINGLLEHLRGTARGFRNIVNYTARCLVDAGGFRPMIHSLLWRAPILKVRGMPASRSLYSIGARTSPVLSEGRAPCAGYSLTFLPATTSDRPELAHCRRILGVPAWFPAWIGGFGLLVGALRRGRRVA